MEEEVQMSHGKKVMSWLLPPFWGFLKRESIAVQGKGGRNGVTRLSQLSLVPQSLPEVLNDGFSASASENS